MNARRWWKWLYDRRLTCAGGHRIPNLFNIDESGSVRCNKFVGSGECGKWIWLFHFPGGGNIVVDVNLEDLETMRRMTTITEKLDYLDIFREEVA